MNTEYIKKEDIYWWNNFINTIVDELPTHNPYKEILELIDKMEDDDNTPLWYSWEWFNWKIDTLKQLKEKIIQLQ